MLNMMKGSAPLLSQVQAVVALYRRGKHVEVTPGEPLCLSLTYQLEGVFPGRETGWSTPNAAARRTLNMDDKGASQYTPQWTKDFNVDHSPVTERPRDLTDTGEAINRRWKCFPKMVC